MLNPLKSEKTTPFIDEPPMTQPQSDVPMQAQHVVTTLLTPPSAEDQAATGPSTE